MQRCALILAATVASGCAGADVKAGLAPSPDASTLVVDSWRWLGDAGLQTADVSPASASHGVPDAMAAQDSTASSPDMASPADAASEMPAPSTGDSAPPALESCDPLATAPCPSPLSCSYDPADGFRCRQPGAGYSQCTKSTDCSTSLSCLPLHSWPDTTMCLVVCNLKIGKCSADVGCWPIGDAAPGVGYCSK